MSKQFFNIFQNNGSRADETKIYIFGEDNKQKEVVADYRISGIGDTPPTGAAHKVKSKAGNTVITVKVSIGGDTWYGVLNIHAVGMAAFKAVAAQPKGERSGLYGTFTNKDKKEMDVAGWVRVTENGQVFISCSMDEPWQKGKAAPEPARAAAASSGAGFDDPHDDIPF